MRVSGRVETRRGWAELAGKRFEINRANLSFSGTTQVDPLVDVVATHYVNGGHSGDTVIVHVQGRMSEPDISFGSNVPGVETAGDALAMMMGTGERSAEATQGGLGASTQDFLAGFTAGVLSLTARRELGDVFPVLTVEARRGGAALRAGID